MEEPRLGGGLNRPRFPLRALLFLIVIELAEKMASFMIGMDLISYLMDTQSEYDLKKAAEISNFWGGAASVALLVGAIVDRTFARQRLTIVMVCSLAYIMGLCMLTMAEFIPMLKPCRLLGPTCTKIHTILFFVSVSVIGIVSGGLKSSLQSLIDSQYDDHLMTWWKVGISTANFLCSLGISYSIYLMGWGYTSLFLLVNMTIGIGLYCRGKPAYRVRMPTQNPNPPLRINRSMLILFWITSCIVFGLYSAQISTFFVVQSDIMNRSVHGTELPPTLFVCISTLGVQPIVFLLGKFVVPISGRSTNRERDNNFLKRTQVGIVLGLIGMVISGIVERKRITTQRHGAKHIGYSDLSAFCVLPQGILYATIEGLMLGGISEYFEEHWASSLAPGLYTSAVGIGSWANILLVKAVDRITKQSERSWFGRDMDSSRVDKFYWVVFAIILLHLIIFRFVAAQIQIRGLER